ncbi:NUDIX hydrolase [Kitasatospora griseola]|uniref:hypothetical protein n=1 Tax=Kitasatospora griseola TaxID=2064 RepID=UPI0038286377
MTTARTARPPAVPNRAIRELRGNLSAREFATLVRKAAQQIGEHVYPDARYIGRLEDGEIRCPNYAYQRVFAHMWPKLSWADLGFAPRKTRRGRRTSAPATAVPVRGDGVTVAHTPLGRGFALFEVESAKPQTGPDPDALVVLVQNERSRLWNLPGAPWGTGTGEHPAAIAARHAKEGLGTGLSVSSALLDIGVTASGGTTLVFDGGTITPLDAALMRPLPTGEYCAVQVVPVSELSELATDDHVPSRIARALKNKREGCGIPPPAK